MQAFVARPHVYTKSHPSGWVPQHVTTSPITAVVTQLSHPPSPVFDPSTTPDTCFRCATERNYTHSLWMSPATPTRHILHPYGTHSLQVSFFFFYCFFLF